MQKIFSKMFNAMQNLDILPNPYSLVKMLFIIHILITGKGTAFSEGSDHLGIGRRKITNCLLFSILFQPGIESGIVGFSTGKVD